MNLSLPLAIEAFGLADPAGEKLDWSPRIEITKHTKERDGRLSRYLTLRPKTLEDKALPKTIERALRFFADKPRKVLTVGLGNPSIASDRLGYLTAGKLSPTDRLKTVAFGVEAHTGLSTVEVVRALARSLGFDLVVVVDALACAKPQNLVRTIQLTDEGAFPGHGVGNRRAALDRDTLGVEVLSVGIPLIAHTDPYGEDVCVTPVDVEKAVEQCASLLSSAIEEAWA